MPRATRASAAAAQAAPKRSRSPSPLPASTQSESLPKKTKRVKKEVKTPSPDAAESKPADQATPEAPMERSATSPNKSAAATQAKKLKALETYRQTPFPDYARPSAQQCQDVCDALATMHHLPQRPVKIEKDKMDSVGAACGLVPNVLDALVRTILSQNTTNKNSSTARRSIEEHFGTAAEGGPDYAAVMKATQDDLEDAIRCGGLAKTKSRVIKTILDEVFAKYGKLSLDHLHATEDQEAMRELVSYHGVGPKTASCVLLFCLSRESFAVDTHVFRITKALGWTPSRADRESAFQHLDVRIPGPLKYPLHSMLVRHGRECSNCSANASPRKGQKDGCPLRPFLHGKPKELNTEITGDRDQDKKEDVKSEEAKKADSEAVQPVSPGGKMQDESEMHGLSV